MTDAPVPPPARRDDAAALLPALVAAVVALTLYVPSVWGHEFVNYDDPYVASADNPAIGQGLQGFLSLLSPTGRPFMNAWLPLYYGSLGLDHWAFGSAPLGWHLHSVALHAAGAAMVALIAGRVGLGTLGAVVAGAAFAAHPAATENVAWIASRKDVLSFLWMSFAALAYLDGVRRGKPWLHVAGCVCLAVSMTAKGTTLVLPLMLAAHAWFVPRGAATVSARLRPVVPYAVVAALLTAVHLWVASKEQTAGAATGASLGALLAIDLEVVLRYAGLVWFPFPPIVRQSVEHGIAASSISWGATVGGAVVAIVWALAIVTLRNTRPLVAAALLAAAVAFVPFNNLLPRTSVLFAERYAHVALLPVALLVGALARRDGAARGIGLALPAALAIVTVFRLPVWRDAVTLWEDAAEKAPSSALVRAQLADAFATRARLRGPNADLWTHKAETAWRDAMSLATDDLMRMRAEEGLGAHLLTTGPGGQTSAERVGEAIAFLDAAVARLDAVEAAGDARDRARRRAALLANRATAHELLGDAEKSLDDWRAAVQADDRNVTALNGLARAYLTSGMGKEASEMLERSAAVAPDDLAAARERSKMRLAAGDVPGAKRELERALERRPDDYDALIDLAALDASLQRPIDAERRLRRALAIRPGDERALQGAAAALLDQAQAQASRDALADARNAALEASRLAPTSSAPEQMLGIIARRGGDLEEATVHLRRARELFPAGMRIREALASVLLERAVVAFDAQETESAHVLCEEAVAVAPPAVATRTARLEWGVDGWPDPPPPSDAKATVARRAAVRGLAYLAAGRAAEAASELQVAETATRGGEPLLRRNAVRLLVRALFLAGRPDDAVAAAEELPGLPAAGDSWSGWADLASVLVERAIVRRAAADAERAKTDLERARQILDTAASHGMPASRRHLRRGESYFAEERFVDATREFDLAAAADPADPEPLLDRAAVWRTHFLLEEDKSYLKGAEGDLRAALAIRPSDPRAMAALGEVLCFAMRPSEAYPWLQRALLADPSQAGARRLLVDLAVRAGRAHLEKRELKEARDVADRAVALGAPSPDAALFLGDVLRAQGEWDASRAAYERAESEYPASEEPRAALARYYFDVGHRSLMEERSRLAARAFHRSVSYDQRKFDTSAAKERLHSIAVAAFRRALGLVEDRRAKEAAGDADGARALALEAAESFETSLVAEPTPEARFNLAVLLAEAGELEKALVAWTDAIAGSGDDAALRLGRATVLFRLGRWDEASADYGWVVANRPEGDADRAAAERQLRWIAEQRGAAPPPPR